MRQEPLPIANYDVTLVSIEGPLAKLRITNGKFKGQTIFMPVLDMSPKKIAVSHKEYEHDKGITVIEIAKPIND